MVEHGEQGGAEWNAGAVTAPEERPGFDLPAIRIDVTAPPAAITCCPACGAENRRPFPAGVTGPVQYGLDVKPWAASFSSEFVMPLERTAPLFEDLVYPRRSDATLLTAGQELAHGVELAMEAVKAQWQAAAGLHPAEAGVRVNGQVPGRLGAALARLTPDDLQAKRGHAAREEAGILPAFKGAAVHDPWNPYLGDDTCAQGRCTAPPRRDLPDTEQHYGQAWAAEMTAWLRDMKPTVEATPEHCTRLPPASLAAFVQRYDRVVNAGEEANPQTPPVEDGNSPTTRGRRNQTPPLNLLDRLRDFKLPVLAFMYDFRVPLDNTWAEREVRMSKVKQQVSGSFRTLAGANDLARIRGYLSTAPNNAVNVVGAIRDAFGGKPFLLSVHLNNRLDSP